MARFGPLHHLGDALVVGDPGRRHLRLGEDAIRYADGKRTVATLRWVDIDAVQLEFPTTRFRFPGALSAAVTAVVVAVSTSGWDAGADDGVAVVTLWENTSRETSERLSLSTHHEGPYWQGSVTATQHLLGSLVTDRHTRAALREPEDLYRQTVTSARR